MMEKNALWCMVLFLSVLNVGGAVNIYIATRANYTFRSNIIGTFQSIQWTHNNNLVVEWETPYFPEPHWYRYGDRAQLNIATGDLTLTMVKKADSGVFRGQFQVNNALQYAEHTVTAVDAVSETKVTCEQNHTDITLLCSVEPPMQAEFTWSGPDGFSHVGNRVYVTRAKGDKAIYYCTAKNEVSQKSAEFNIETCAKDAVFELKVTTEQKDTDITLLCSLETPVRAEFTCTGPNLRSHDGKSVHVTSGKSDNSIYYCTAKK